MRCTHAEKLIPLFAGDDLPAREANALRRHLESCANCRRLADEFEDSRKWMRGFAAPQFDEAMLDDLRDSVLRGISRVETRSRWLQWIVPGLNLQFAASMAVLLLIAFLAAYAYLGSQQRVVPDKKVIVQSSSGGDQKGSTGDGRHNDEGSKVNPSLLPTQHPSRKVVRTNIENRRVGLVHLPDQEIAYAPLPPPPISVEPVIDLPPGGDMAKDDARFNREMTRIEFQTADPNIRVIWLTPKDSNSSSTKPNANTQ